MLAQFKTSSIQASAVSDAGAADAAPLDDAELNRFHELGFIVRRQVFSPSEIAALADEASRLLTDCEDLIDQKNLRCRFMAHVETGERIFEVFDPVNDISPLCARFTEDRRVRAMVESIYGGPACLFKEKLIFKPPGALGYQLHQDIPRSWAGFPRSFLTVYIPIDAPSEENGCTELFSGYHHEFIFPEKDDVYMLPDDCVAPGRCFKLLLEPGDVAVFHGLTPHRSAANRSDGMRRAFYVSYNARCEGGDQRAQHYAQFHDFMRERLAPEARESLYFR